MIANGTIEFHWQGWDNNTIDFSILNRVSGSGLSVNNSLIYESTLTGTTVTSSYIYGGSVTEGSVIYDSILDNSVYLDSTVVCNNCQIMSWRRWRNIISEWFNYIF